MARGTPGPNAPIPLYLAPANEFLALALDCISDTLFKLTMLSVSSRAFIWFKLPSRSKGCESRLGHPKSGMFVKVYLRMI